MKGFFKSKFEEYLVLSVILITFIVFYLETDIYTPSFPQMMLYFQTSEHIIQLLLSVNFLGLCLSSLVFGPASDAFGRKKVLCIGVGIFMINSIGCSLAQSIDWMIIFRFFQGIGCGAIASVALTTLFDVYSPEKYSRLVAICNAAIGGIMAAAPIIGNYIAIKWGWRANFFLIALLSLITFISNLFFIRETLPIQKRSSFNLRVIIKNYFTLITNVPFIGHTLIWCLMFSLSFVFISNLSLIFIEYLNVSIQNFGFYQTTIMSSFFVGSILSSFFIKGIGMPATKTFGSILFLAGVFGLLVLSLRVNQSALAMVIFMSLVSLGGSFSCAIYFSYSLTYIDDSLKGSAMSLTQSLRLAISSMLVWISARQFNGTIRPIGYIAFFASLVPASALYLFLYKKKQLFANPKTNIKNTNIIH